MVEGNANKAFPLILAMLEQNPQLLHHLLHKLAEAISLYLNAQIAAGAEVVMIFDTWGSLLNTANYQTYSLHYIQHIIAAITAKNAASPVPVILFTKASGQWLELMMQTGCDVISVDWSVNLAEARKRVGNNIALQGNLNPSVLCQSEEMIRAEVARILAEYGPGEGHIFNLGHGITPDVPPEHVAILVDAVHTLSRRDLL
jgi:uroporphyrinogen decarboxylase